jgi:hypothetical protein
MQVMMSFFIFPLIAINLELTKRLAAHDYDFRFKPDVKELEPFNPIFTENENFGWVNKWMIFLDLL